MSTRSVAVVAGLIGGVGWSAKIVVMALQGGPDPDSIPEALAFFSGLLGVIVAAAAAGAYLARDRRPAWRIGAAIGAVLAVAAITGVGQAALGALPGDGWLQEEAIFGLIGVIAVIAATLALRGRGDASAAGAP
jgi:uncharacterized membrane protein YfcA